MKEVCIVDTNVLVSALLKRKSIPGKIVQAVLAGIVIPVYSNEILNEYKEVLSRKKFNFSNNVIESVIKAIVDNGIKLSGIQTDETPSDPKDVIFYEVTMDARQKHDAHLVTGDIKDFPIKPFVVIPAEMMQIIDGKRKTSRTK